jgi:hypothetical protein
MEHKSAFSFQSQLKVGQAGEDQFIENYHSPLVVVPDRWVDFRRVTDGKSLELKTDTYQMSRTPNMFFERYSDFHKKTPGGPWRARRDRVDLFVYFFIKDQTYFEFTDIKLLCKTLDKLTKKKGMIMVKNRGFITMGWTVPREAVSHLYTQHTFYTDNDNHKIDGKEDLDAKLH